MPSAVTRLICSSAGATAAAPRSSLKQELAQQGIDLQAPLRKNMPDLRAKAFVSQLMSSRRLVEIVIWQLTERFHIEKARVRDTWLTDLPVNCLPILWDASWEN